MEPPKDAVVVHNVWKAYGFRKEASYVLNGVTLTVPRGTIYGLLGPSGCGKTTLLRSIIGTVRIHKGTILVLGQSPESLSSHSKKSSIGYMPQDIALNVNLTLNENLQLYGTIFGMTKAEIQRRSHFLVEFLSISHPSRNIENLSGGQKRRASFAVALLHEPELLILDEPTVGVDPILRKKIWNYLYSCTLKNTSIVITTHYIEEARMASNVGLMQNGKILTEGPPNELMNQHNCSTLEKVFLKLCMDIVDTANTCNGKEWKDAESGEHVHQAVLLNKKSETDKFGPADPSKESEGNDVIHKDKCNTKSNRLKNYMPKKCLLDVPRWHRIQALVIKNIRFFIGRKEGFGFMLLLPPMIMILASFSVGQPPFGLRVGVVNHDLEQLSTLFLKNIKGDVLIQVTYSNLSEAKRDMDMGSIMGILHFKKNFSETMKLRFSNGGLSDNYTIEQSSIEIEVDVLNPTTAYYFNVELLLAFQKFAQVTLNEMNLNPASGSLPIKYEETQVYGSLDVTFDEFLVPGILVCVVFYTGMALSALGLIIEKQCGSYERMIISGVVSTEVVISNALSAFIFIVIKICIVYITTFLILGYNCQGSFALMMLLLILQAVCGLCLGMAIASTLKEEILAMVICIATWCFLILTQNFLWPTEGLPLVGRFLSRMLPQTYAIEAVRSIMNRGWGILHSQVLYGLGITITWTGVFMLFAMIMFHRIY